MLGSRRAESRDVAVPPPRFSAKGAKRGVRLILPVAASVYAYGSVYGVLARQAGMSLPEATLTSSLVFAGSAQFIILELWHSPLPAATLILTTLVVNLRHVLMGIALQPWFSQLSRTQKYLSAFFLTDENWALSMRELRQGYRDAAILLGSGLVVFIAWVLATVTGHTMGALLPDPARWGLDFAFLAVFLALIAGMWRGKSDVVPWVVAAAVAVFSAQTLPGNWYILLGGLAGSVVGAAIDGKPDEH